MSLMPSTSMERLRNAQWESSITHPGKRRFWRGFRNAKRNGTFVPWRSCGYRSQPPDIGLPIEQIITHPPLAVFEILSPEDTLQRLKRRLEDYRIMGIEEIRVIDPQDSAFYRYEDGQLLRNDTFSHAGKGIVFEMNQIKDLLDV
jgi:Uma2 family endonuclease